MKTPKNIPNNANYCPIQYNESVIIDSYVWVNESGKLSHKIFYPKSGKSHFYSMVNYIDNCFDEQYPSLAYQIWFQERYL